MTDATQMTEVWVEVFGDDSIEPTTDFFDLGGSSLQAITLVERIDEEFSVRIPVESVLEEATPAGLAALIENHVNPTS
jgi:acyl carrier protein